MFVQINHYQTKYTDGFKCLSCVTVMKCNIYIRLLLVFTNLAINAIYAVCVVYEHTQMVCSLHRVILNMASLMLMLSGVNICGFCPIWENCQ